MPAAPPKPWERAGAGSSSTMPAAAAPAVTAPVAAATDAATPALPTRPVGMTTAAATASPYGSALGASRYGGLGGLGGGMGGYSPYGGGLGGYGGYGSSFGSYGSPYSRYGAGGYGGGFGMGGMYGSSPYGGYGGMGGMPGAVNPDGTPSSLTQRMEQGTAATFQIIESIVGAFGGFAQMLESTFMATHSSFFAMLGVAEQFGSLRTYLGQVLGVFSLVRLVRDLIARLTGRAPPPRGPDAHAGFGVDSFRTFEAGGPVAGPSNAIAPPRPSRTPLVMFFMTVIGLPWLMTKIVRHITERAEAEARRRAEQGLPPVGASELAVDPASLTFVRATHAFAGADPTVELTFAPGDVIAILTPAAERGNGPTWWRGRLRDGRIGWLPSTHVEVIPMPPRKDVDGPLKPAKQLDGPGPPPPPPGTIT